MLGDLVRKMFIKYELVICLALIMLYLILNSYSIEVFGELNYRTVIINTLFSLGLIALIMTLKKWKYYGFTKVKHPKKFLYFIPLILIVSVNLWNGININNTPAEIVLHILNMINVGFIEEIIFRGFLFKMMAKDKVETAILVSSLTFGIGHIINLFTGAAFLPTLLQVFYAFSIGYLFVTIFYKSKSIIPCIVTHCLVNSLSIFNTDNTITNYIASVFLIIVPLIYAGYINKKTPSRRTSDN